MKNKPGIPEKIACRWEAKKSFRRQQAGLPFERKIEIVVRLQEIARDIRKTCGRKAAGMVWTSSCK